MKRSKRLWILLAVLVVVCLATVGVMRIEEHKEQIKNSGEVILSISPDKVTSLAWEYGEESLAFHRDGSWNYDGDEFFPVDQDKMAALLKVFEGMSASFIIEEVEDFSQYGMSDPTCTIKLTTSDRSYEVVLGAYSTMDSLRYLTIGDGNVYLVTKDPMDEFEVVLSDLIDHDEMPALDKVDKLTISGAENYELRYEEESIHTYGANDLYFTERGGKTVPLDTTRVGDYLKVIKYLAPTDYVTYNATAEELETFGLTVPELTVTAEYTVENEEEKTVDETFVLHMSRNPEEMKAAEEEAEEGKEPDYSSVTAYVRVGDSPIVYKISNSNYEKLAACGYDDLRHAYALTADISTLLQFDILLDGTEYSFTSKKEEEELTYYYGDEELSIMDFRSELKGIKAVSFTDEAPTLKEEISITVKLDNENFPQVHLAFYRYDGTHCLFRLNGESVSLVERAAVVDLMEEVYQIVLG